MSRKWRGGPASRRPPSSAAPTFAIGATALTLPSSRLRPFPRDPVEDAHPLLDLAFADDQRRQNAQHVLAGGQAEQPLGPQFGDEIAGGQRMPSRCPEPRNPANSFGCAPTRASSLLHNSRAMRWARSKKLDSSITSSTALPAATASGLPPKVEPWLPATMPIAAFSVARQAPIGMPLPSAFATAITSGATPAHSWANNLPVRPMPDCTSSYTRTRPYSSQTARNP